MKKNARVISVAILVLAGVAVWYFTARNTVNRTIEFPDATSEVSSVPASSPAIDPQKKEAQEIVDGEATAQEIIFQKEIFVSHMEEADSSVRYDLAVDGVVKKIGCPDFRVHGHDGKIVAGFIRGPGSQKFYLQCQVWAQISSATVVAISYFDAKGVRATKVIAQRLGHEGETHDLRSWITRNPKTQELRIESASFVSSMILSDAGEGANASPSCRSGGAILNWNSNTQDFEEVLSADPLKKVKGPIFAAEDCLDKNGDWK